MHFCSIYVSKSMFVGYSPVPAYKAEKGTYTRQFSSDSMSSTHLHALAGYTFTKFINELGKLIYSDSYTKTNSADTCIKSSNSCSLVEIHGAETLLFLMFAANVNTHTHRHGAAASDTYTPVACVNLTQQASRSYLVCLPVCLPTVFSLLLRCTGLCLM